MKFQKMVCILFKVSDNFYANATKRGKMLKGVKELVEAFALENVTAAVRKKL